MIMSTNKILDTIEFDRFPRVYVFGEGLLQCKVLQNISFINYNTFKDNFFIF